MSIDAKKFKVEKAGNTATLVYEDDAAFYADTELPKTEIQRVFKHASEYVTDCATVAADVATKLMAKDKKIDEVIMTMPYGVSKRGNVTARAKRTVTFPGIGDNPSVTRSDIRISVRDPLTKTPRSKLKELQAKMTEQLLS